MLWSGHLIHVSLTSARGYISNIELHSSYTKGFVQELYRGNFMFDVSSIDKDSHIFSSSINSGTSILTFFGGLKPETMSLHVTDLAHHHLAVGILFVLLSQLSNSFYKTRLPYFKYSISSQHSPHLSIAIISILLSSLSSIVASHVSLAPSYVYLGYDYVTTVAIYVHHQYISSLLMISSMVHGLIFVITEAHNYSSFKIQTSCSSHLSWVSCFLGFHTLGIYIHNDTVLSFGNSFCQILIEPVFATHIISTVLFMQPLGPGDFLSHHAIALGLHVTVQIMLKGALDSTGSKLVPDKLHYPFGFACDGPGRGGSCDVSAFDSVYLALFWMLNTHSWIAFYFHWKHLSLLSQETLNESSTYLNGWFRDYLFFYSAALINGYNAMGSNDLSVLSWIFLFAHLAWSTGFMFLISWRGYWQELIDLILVQHLKTPFLYDLWSGGISMYTPIALSIVQARFVGLVHFASGFILTYAAFILGTIA